jgi:hypothetical protein
LQVRRRERNKVAKKRRSRTEAATENAWGVFSAEGVWCPRLTANIPRRMWFRAVSTGHLLWRQWLHRPRMAEMVEANRVYRLPAITGQARGWISGLFGRLAPPFR